MTRVHTKKNWDLGYASSRTNLSYLQQMIVYLLRLCIVVPNYCVHGSNTQPWWAHSWSELAATNAPFQDEAVRTILGMNQKHILFFCPRIFQPPSLPQNFPLLPTSPPFLPTSPLPPPSPHFSLIPSPKLGRALELEQHRALRRRKHKA